MSPTTHGHRSICPLVRAYYEFVKGNTTGGRCKREVDDRVGARGVANGLPSAPRFPGHGPVPEWQEREERWPTFSAITAAAYHPEGVNTLLGDGSVRFVKSTIDGMVWRALGTVAGGEVVDLEGD